MIVDPRLEVFHVALNVALHELREAYRPFSDEVMRVLPLEHSGTGEVLPWSPPPREKIRELEQLIDNVKRATGRINCWTSDFRTEMQGLLMRDLFPHDLPKRQPIDPHYLTVTLDGHERLIRFFEWPLRRRPRPESSLQSNLAKEAVSRQSA